MRITSLGTAAAVALLISGAALAQQPAQTPPAQTPTTAAPAAPVPPPAASAPVQATPVPTPSEDAQPKMAETPAERSGHGAANPHLSPCKQAIRASEKALDKSQASPEVIAAAWQHIEAAKQEKGSACKEEAKTARDML